MVSTLGRVHKLYNLNIERGNSFNRPGICLKANEGEENVREKTFDGDRS